LEEEALRRAFASPRRYSITELETYNLCPFRYFMKHTLGLRPEPDGGGAADKGTLYHAALRRHFRARQSDTPQAETLQESLQAELESGLENHSVDARLYRRRMMERALKDALSGFAKREETLTGLFGLTPTYFELAFGLDEEALLEDEEIDAEARRDYDPASTARPLLIPSPDGGPPISLCGAIDRIDLDAEGRRALVMDYKLGNSVEFAAIKAGQSLQMPLYLMAIEQLWDKTGAVACYDSPRDAGRRRFVRTEHAEMKTFRPVAGVESGSVVKPVNRDEYAETIQEAQAAVQRAVAEIAEGNIFPTPGAHCAHCDYLDVCRFSRDNVHDGEAISSVSSL
jgi:ATP-dependent helicase/DNAse subunit B